MRQLVVYAPDAIVGRPGAPYLAVARLRGKRNAAARRRTAARLEKLRLMRLGVFCFPRRRSVHGWYGARCDAALLPIEAAGHARA